ncbi:putative glutathione s-transferase parc [Quercus suber]|uniref:Glutathione s-transferase parc n=1 Tax=Quercus suber TaxID=58331 RepID=A0AAW0MAR3_QUESU
MADESPVVMLYFKESSIVSNVTIKERQAVPLNLTRNQEHLIWFPLQRFIEILWARIRYFVSVEYLFEEIPVLVSFYTRFYSIETLRGFSIEAECPKIVAWANRCMQKDIIAKTLPDQKKFVILYLPPSFSLPTLNKLKIIPRLASRKLEQELHQIWVSSVLW